jgi:addiction module RelE/StbE family toxin
MGYKVIWTDEAIADLRQIVARIAKDNPPAAVKMGEELIRKSLLLAEHPRMGRVLREAKRDTLREIIIRPYRLIYEIDGSSSTVMVRVLWHGARREPEIE